MSGQSHLFYHLKSFLCMVTSASQVQCGPVLPASHSDRSSGLFEENLSRCVNKTGKTFITSLTGNLNCNGVLATSKLIHNAFSNPVDATNTDLYDLSIMGTNFDILVYQMCMPH